MAMASRNRPVTSAASCAEISGVLSSRRNRVLDILFANLPATLELGVATLLTSLVIGIPVGVLSAAAQGRAFDNVSRVMAVIFDAVPPFWLGLMLLLFFGKHLGLLPMGGRCAPNLFGTCAPLFQRFDYLILPTFVFAATFIALFSRYVRTSTLEVLNQDYIRTASSKGLSQSTVYFRHAFRNAMIPVATLLGPIITNLWAGAIVIETVFGWPRRRAHRLHIRHSARLSSGDGRDDLRGSRHDTWLFAVGCLVCAGRSAHSPVIGRDDEREPGSRPAEAA